MLSRQKVAWFRFRQVIFTSCSSLPSSVLYIRLCFLFILEPIIERDPVLTSFVEPTSGLPALRCRVYKDLHQKGYWLTLGGKFGGDFLVYPGKAQKYILVWCYLKILKTTVSFSFQVIPRSSTLTSSHFAWSRLRHFLPSNSRRWADSLPT